MSRLSIIIVTHNSSRFISACLKTLLDITERDDTRLVIIDNASCDKTTSIIKDFLPNVKLIQNKKNLGLSYAINQGIAAIPAKYYLILNPDVLISDETIKKLVDYLDNHPDVGIIGPRLEYLNGKLQLSARTFPTILSVLARGIGLTEKRKWLPSFLHKHLMTDLNHGQTQEVDWILGAAFMVRGQTLSEIGHFNESHFLYYGDVDLCWRAWKKNWKVVYYPPARAIHNYQRASAHGRIFNPLKWSHFFSAMRFLIKKNFS